MIKVQEIRVRRMEILFIFRITRTGRKGVCVKKVLKLHGNLPLQPLFCCSPTPTRHPHGSHPNLCISLSTPCSLMPLGLYTHWSLLLVYLSLTCAPGQPLISFKTGPRDCFFLSPCVIPLSLSQMPLVCADPPQSAHFPTAPTFYY